MSDKRLTPNERKNAILWQLYLTHQELTELRKRHTLRLKSIESGKSNLQGGIEYDVMRVLDLDAHVAPKSKRQIKSTKEGWSVFRAMVDEAEKLSIYHWLITHKGIGESLAVKLIALIDDISKFDTVAKLWRYSGYGLSEYWQDKDGKVVAPFAGWKWVGQKDDRRRVWTVCCTEDQEKDYQIPDGNDWVIYQNIEKESYQQVDFIRPDDDWKLVKSIDKLVSGYHSPYNRELKSLLFNFSESFVKQSTPEYRELYDYEKARQHSLHPDMTDMHCHNRALRKVRKELLKQLWIVWREMEGLSTI